MSLLLLLLKTNNTKINNIQIYYRLRFSSLYYISKINTINMNVYANYIKIIYLKTIGKPVENIMDVILFSTGKYDAQQIFL